MTTRKMGCQHTTGYATQTRWRSFELSKDRPNQPKVGVCLCCVGPAPVTESGIPGLTFAELCLSCRHRD